MIISECMPTYEYQCECGKVFEYEQRISDAPLKICPFCSDEKDCPQCGRKDVPCKVERLINGGNFILKGGGWYKDGYGASKPEKPTEKKTESKPAEPAPAKKCSTTCGCD